MKRTLLAVTIAALALSGLAYAAEKPKPAPPKPPAYTGLKKRIAVLPIVVGADNVAVRSASGEEARTTTVTWVSDRNPGEVGAGLTEQLTTALINSGRFIVLERKALDEVLGEQDLGASGRVNPETAAAKGKVIGAEWLIKGTITDRKST